MKKVTFKTERKKQDNLNKLFFFGIIGSIVFILLISFSAIMIKSDFNIQTALSGDIQVTDNEEEIITKKSNVKFERNYMIFFNDSVNKKLTMLFNVHIKLPGKKTEVKAYNPDTQIKYNSFYLTFTDVYNQFGEKALLDCFSDYTETKINHYIGSDENSFRTMIDYLGNYTLIIDNNIEYRGDDFNLFLIKGKNSIRGDSLYKYFIYLTKYDHDSLLYQENLLSDIISYYLTEDNINKSTKIFAKLSNTLITDISIVDFKKYENILGLFL